MLRNTVGGFHFRPFLLCLKTGPGIVNRRQFPSNELPDARVYRATAGQLSSPLPSKLSMTTRLFLCLEPPSRRSGGALVILIGISGLILASLWDPRPQTRNATISRVFPDRKCPLCLPYCPTLNNLSDQKRGTRPVGCTTVLDV